LPKQGGDDRAGRSGLKRAKGGGGRGCKRGFVEKNGVSKAVGWSTKGGKNMQWGKIPKEKGRAMRARIGKKEKYCKVKASKT